MASYESAEKEPGLDLSRQTDSEISNNPPWDSLSVQILYLAQQRVCRILRKGKMYLGEMR